IARQTADTLDDPIAKSLALWIYFYNEDPNVSITDADAFLDAHADWPAAARIQRHVEKRFRNSTPARDILDFYDTRDPVGGHGKVHLARAQFANGNDEAGALHLRDAWVNHTFPLKDERYILANFAQHLRAEDHVARVDHLLWKRQVTNARRVFPRLPTAERRKAEARAFLLLSAKGAVDRYNALSDEDRRDSGVMHAAVRYFRRAGEEPRAVAIARNAPTQPEALRNPSRWWTERDLLRRWAIREKRFEDAYAMASGHGLEPGLQFSEAEFFAGWLALRYLGAPERAEVHFKALAATVDAPISVARAHYWLGRAAEAQGQSDKASRLYAIAADHPYTFYGQMAAEKIGGDALARAFATPVTPTATDRATFAARPIVAAMRMLTDVDAPRSFTVFSYHVDDQLETPGEFVLLSDLVQSEGAPHVAVRAGKVSVRRKAFAPEVSYPLIFVPDDAARFAPRELILGLSRQESEFNPRAYSRAGARGLMQLIPSTAQLTARKEGLRYSRSALLDDPVYNMTIGSAHVSHLLEKYNGSYMMTFAAYNAGPHRVTQWVEAFGDPRSEDIDPIDWAESIPFSETRNYVQRVLENMQVYRARFSGAAIPGKLARDLERGGVRGRAGALPGVAFAGALTPAPARTEQFAAAATLSAPPAPIAPPSIAPDPEAALLRDEAQAPSSPSTNAAVNAPAPQSNSKAAVPTARVIDLAEAPSAPALSGSAVAIEEKTPLIDASEEAPVAEDRTSLASPAPISRTSAAPTPRVAADDLNALQSGAFAAVSAPSDESAQRSEAAETYAPPALADNARAGENAPPTPTPQWSWQPCAGPARPRS
ncbi:MAG: transglycosylase SLT domain-containing protein, partial [Pseudomonadota bacterium]